MAAPANAKSGSAQSLSRRFTRKVGPLPVWGWAALILGAYLAWSHFHTSSSSQTSDASQTTAAPVADTGGAASDSGAQLPSSGGGSVADQLDPTIFSDLYSTNAATIDTLTNAILEKQSLDAAHPDEGAPAASTVPPGGGGPASSPSSTATAATGAGGHMTQTTAGRLQWGGVTFTSKAAFNQWAKAHGTTVDRELNNHPQARALYSSLR